MVTAQENHTMYSYVLMQLYKEAPIFITYCSPSYVHPTELVSDIFQGNQ